MNWIRKYCQFAITQNWGVKVLIVRFDSTSPFKCVEFRLWISNYRFLAKHVSVDAQYGPQMTMNNWIRNNSWMTSNDFSAHEPYSISIEHFKPWLNVCYLSHHLVSGRWQWPKTFMKLTYISNVQNQMWFVASSIGRDLTRPDT